MRRYFLLIFFLNCNLWGSFEGYEYGSAAISMGCAFTGLVNDCFAIFFNPAGLSKQKSNEISFFISPNQFGIKELSTAVVASRFSFKFGTIGFAVKKYGFELYSETTTSFAYSKEVHGLYFGSTLNINYLTIKNYGNDITLGVDAGILIRLTKDFFMGLNIKNINAPTIGVKKEKLPIIILSGISYSPIYNFVITLDLQKEFNADVAFASGAEYKLLDVVYLRFGVRNIPSTYSIGMGLFYDFFKVDYSFFNHDQLGTSHSVTINLIFGGKDVI